MSRYIAIEVDGETRVHAASSIAGYVTLCALDGGVSGADGQKIVGLQIGARINCPQCRDLIMEAKQFRPRDFER